MNLKKFPHVYVILFFLIIIAAILTWIVPPNAYDFKLDAEGNPTRVIDPASYHAVDRNGIDPWEMVQAIPKGMGQVASIIFFIFIVGGSFNMIQATGAVEAGIRATALSLKGKEFWLAFLPQKAYPTNRPIAKANGRNQMFTFKRGRIPAGELLSGRGVFVSITGDYNMSKSIKLVFGFMEQSKKRGLGNENPTYGVLVPEESTI